MLNDVCGIGIFVERAANTNNSANKNNIHGLTSAKHVTYKCKC